MAKDILHVVPQNEGWAVKREGNERASSAHSTQKEAIDSAHEMAEFGDDIVIHRADGTIRERVTRSETTNGNGRARTPIQPHDIVSVGSRVNWQAILAGLAVTVAVYVCLTMLAVALGVSTMDYVQNRTFAIGGAIFGILSLLAALFLGGLVTTRMSTRETMGEAVVYGVLLWATLFFVLVVTGLNLGSGFGLMPQFTARQSGVIQAPAERASLDEQERLRRELEQRGVQLVADMDRVTLAWWTFAGMVLSVLAGIGGAVVGTGPELVFRRLLPLQRPAEARVVVSRPA